MYCESLELKTSRIEVGSFNIIFLLIYLFLGEGVHLIQPAVQIGKFGPFLDGTMAHNYSTWAVVAIRLGGLFRKEEWKVKAHLSTVFHVRRAMYCDFVYCRRTMNVTR